MEIIKEIMLKKGYFKLSVKGQSMKPWIPSGSEIFIEQINETPQLGSIVMVNHNQKVFVHRIIRFLENECFILKGDNNPRIDGVFQKDSIIGLVSRVKLPNGKSRNLPMNKFFPASAANVSRVLGKLFSCLNLTNRFAINDFTIYFEKTVFRLFSKISISIQNLLRCLEISNENRGLK